MTPIVYPVPRGHSLPDTLLDSLGVGWVYLTPVYATHDSATLVALAYVSVNALAQQLLGLPAQPTAPFGTAGPQQTALFTFCRDAFGAGDLRSFAPGYVAADGTRWQVVAQRHETQLVVRFTLGNDRAIAPAQMPQAAQETAFHQVLAQTPAAICILRGPEYRFEYVNPAFAELFANRPLEGLPAAVGLPEAIDQGFIALLDRVYATGETFYGTEVPMRITQPDGQPPKQHYFNFTYQAHLLDGHAERLSVFAYNVTEQVWARQQVQQLLAELEGRVAAEQRRAQLERFFQHAPVAISVHDGPDLVYELVNPRYQALFPGRLLLGLPLREALPEIQDHPVWQQLQHVYATGETHEETSQLIPLALCAGGPLQDRYLHYVLQARYDARGRIDGVVAVVLDRTAQVRGQQRAEQLQAEVLAAAERRVRERETFYQIFEQAPVALALLQGPDYVIEVANPAICQMWGRERAAVLGQPLLAVLPEVVEQGIPELLGAVYRTGRPFVAAEHPVRLRRQTQWETVYFQFVYQPLTDDQGLVTAIVIVANDVSPRVGFRQQLTQANEELRVANAQLTHANVDLDNIIYTASHDLKTPIANIESLLLLLREPLSAEPQQADLVPWVLEMMQASVERFQFTIAQLTNLTHLQQVPAASDQAVDLAAVVEAVRLDLAPLLEATDTHLTVAIAPGETVRVAPQHVRSVAYNLLHNAIKYRHPDRVPHVQLRCRREASRAILEVQDNGLGLSQEQQDKLFTLFQRLHPQVEGSGVGLYMVRRIVENAGGTIQVQSEVGVGSTFIVSIPA